MNIDENAVGAWELDVSKLGRFRSLYVASVHPALEMYEIMTTQGHSLFAIYT